MTNGGFCYRPGYERGPWYEIECLKNDIIRKEKRGDDADFERGLLKSWSKYPGYEKAGEVLKALSTPLKDGQGVVNAGILGKDVPPGTTTPPDFDTTIIMKQIPGRPRIDDGEISRTTAWRRQKELQRGCVI
jgi:hypothetical protein